MPKGEKSSGGSLADQLKKAGFKETVKPIPAEMPNIGDSEPLTNEEMDALEEEYGNTPASIGRIQCGVVDIRDGRDGSDGKYIYVDRNGKQIVPGRYDGTYPFKVDTKTAFVKISDAVWEIDVTGTKIEGPFDAEKFGWGKITLG